MLKEKVISASRVNCVLFNEVYNKVAASYYGVGCVDFSKKASALRWAFNSCCDYAKCKISDFFDRFTVPTYCPDVECGGVVPCNKITIEKVENTCETSCANIDTTC